MKKSISAKPGTAANILLVDDNRHGSMARKALLEEQGFTAVTVSNGEEAAEALSKGKFDLVVTDFKMPKMNGIELIRGIREAQPELPVILLSGFVDPLGLDEKSTGADAVIAKSAHEMSHLLRAATRLLARRTARKPPATQKSTKVKVRTQSV